MVKRPRIAQRYRTIRSLLPRLPDWAILLFFFALILLQAIPSLWQESATYDEIMRQLPGYLSLTVGEYRIHTAHPPLIKMLAALPLFFMDVQVPPPPERWTRRTRNLFFHDFLYRANDADRLVLLGRLAVLPLTLLLGGFVFLWAKALFGRGAATFALFLYSFEPNILAHGRLMNTDLGIACFFFLTLYFFFRVVQQVTLRHLTLTGLSLGLALVTKYSALLAAPILLLLGIAVVLSRHPWTLQLKGLPPATVTDWTRKLVVLLGILIVIGLIAYGVIWGMYRFRFEGGIDPRYAYHLSLERLLPKKPVARQAILWVKEMKLLPEAYLHGLSFQWSYSSAYPAFLMGEVSADGWWYYFIVTFLLKTPLPLLLLLLMTPLALRPLWRKDPVAVLCLLVPVLVFFGTASVTRYNLGHRLILPIYPFLFVMAGSLVPWMMRQRAFVKGGVGVLAAWYVFSSVSVFPHYLAYFNELAGGPENGYKYLVDSNIDWGQDLKGLKRYMDEHGIERVWLSYFGTASPDYYGITYNYLPSVGFLNLQRRYVFHIDKLPLLPGTVAISATTLQGVHLPILGLKRDYFALYRHQTPIAKIGYSIFIYQFE